MSKLFFIGAGKMATAIAGGLVKSGTFDKTELQAYDINPQAAAKFTEATGVACLSGELEEAPLQNAGAVLLAVKPQYLADALNGWKYILETKLIISIAAGISLERLYDLTDSARIVRIMPNTPALVGAGAAVGAMTAEVTPEERALTEKIFRAIGTFSVMDEKHLDAVTGLSGSGPAFVFEFIQALADGGVAEGLSHEAALALAVQTVLGSAEMAARSGEHPAVLKDAVTSPGGTTIRALEVLEDRGFSGAVIQAVRAAAARSRELGGRK